MGLAVQTSGLGHRYGKQIALDRVDLACAPGRLIALLGPNGASSCTWPRARCATIYRMRSTNCTRLTGSRPTGWLDSRAGCSQPVAAA